MKLRACAVVFLAVLLTGAAPPAARTPAPSTWDRIKSGARRILPDALTPGQPQPNAETAPPVAPQQAPVRRDPQVRQATAVEPSRRGPSLFSRAKRPRRTLSEYMAQEKP